MVKTGDECQLTAYMSSHGNDANVVSCLRKCCSRQVSPCGVSNTLPTEPEFNAVGCGMVWEHAEHDAYHDT